MLMAISIWPNRKCICWESENVSIPPVTINNHITMHSYLCTASYCSILWPRASTRKSVSSPSALKIPPGNLSKNF